MATANPPIEDQQAPAPSTETVVWEGHSSQIVNLKIFLYCLLALIVVGALTYGFRLLAARSVDLAAIQRWFYIAFAVLALIPIVIAAYFWIENRNRVYRVTTQRLRISTGVFSKHDDDLELYRVRDYTIQRPFFLRLFRLGNIRLITSDKSTPVVDIRAIRECDTLLDKIRQNVEILRTTKKVREVDFE